ncbi:MAG: hypothetical protein IKM17_07455 [Lentisphaeria bacterium]|nr:hypothetical protein [Lentisphaeria bacterium]
MKSAKIDKNGVNENYSQTEDNLSQTARFLSYLFGKNFFSAQQKYFSIFFKKRLDFCRFRVPDLAFFRKVISAQILLNLQF